VTSAKKGNYIPFEAHFSGLSEYAGPCDLFFFPLSLVGEKLQNTRKKLGGAFTRKKFRGFPPQKKKGGL